MSPTLLQLMSYNRGYDDKPDGPYSRSGSNRDNHPDWPQPDRSGWSGKSYPGRYNGSNQRNPSGASRPQEEYLKNSYRRRDYSPSNLNENVRGSQDRGLNRGKPPNKWRRNASSQFERYNNRQKHRSPNNFDQNNSHLNNQRQDLHQENRSEKPQAERLSSSSLQEKPQDIKEMNNRGESRDLKGSRELKEPDGRRGSRGLKDKENSDFRNDQLNLNEVGSHTGTSKNEAVLKSSSSESTPSSQPITVESTSYISRSSNQELLNPKSGTENLPEAIVTVGSALLKAKEHVDPPEIHIFTLSVGSPDLPHNDLNYEEQSETETVLSDSVPTSELSSVYRRRGRDPNRKALKRKAIFSSDEEDEDNNEVHSSVQAAPINHESRTSLKKSETKGSEKERVHQSNLKSYKIKRDSTGRSQLQRACKRGDLSEVKAFVAAGANPNECDFGGFTCLHEAALAGHADIVSFLIEKGADVNKQAHEVGDLETPLMDACENKHYETIEILLKHGADPHICNVDGFSTISKLQHLDTSDNSYKRVLKLLDAYVTLNKETQKDNRRSKSIVEDPSEPYFGDLMKKKFNNVYRYAGQGQKESTAENFITHALDLQKMPDILFLAARNGHIELVDILLGLNPNPFDINQKNKIGCTVLHATVGRGFYNVVKFLLSRGANPAMKRDIDGRNAYEIATTSALCDFEETSLLEYMIKKPSATVDSYFEKKETEKGKERRNDEEVQREDHKEDHKENLMLNKVNLEVALEQPKKDVVPRKEEVDERVENFTEETTKIAAKLPVKFEKTDKGEPFQLPIATITQQKRDTPANEPVKVLQDRTKQDTETSFEDRPTTEAVLLATRKRSFLDVHDCTDMATSTLKIPEDVHVQHTHDEEQPECISKELPEFISKEQEELKLKAAEEAKIWQEKMLAKKRARKEMFLQAEKEKERQRREDERRRIEEMRIQEERRKDAILQQALEAKRRALLAQQKQAALELQYVLLQYPIGLQDAFFNPNSTPSHVLRFAPLYIFTFDDEEWVIDLQIALLLSHSVTHIHSQVSEFREELNDDAKDRLWALFFNMIGVGKSGLVDKNGRSKFRDLSLHYIKLTDACDLIRVEDTQVFRLIWEEGRATKVNLSLIDVLRAPAGTKLRNISDDRDLGFVPPKLKKRQDVVHTIHTASSSLW